MAATMVPKTRKPADEFDRDKVLERLFSLPVPPPRRGPRPYPIDQPLGRIMRLKDVLIRDVERMEGCPNSRMMSDYLAGRREISPHHRGALARGLGVDPRVL